MTEINKLPVDGFLVVIVYFKESKDNVQNDIRRRLMPNNKTKSLVDYLQENARDDVEITHHLFALMKSLDLKYLYSLLALSDKLRKGDKGYLVDHHISAVVKNPPGGKKSSRAIGAIEMIRYRCDDTEQVRELYEEIKRWCEKRGWNYEIMFSDWIIEGGENYG